MDVNQIADLCVKLFTALISITPQDMFQIIGIVSMKLIGNQAALNLALKVLGTINLHLGSNNILEAIKPKPVEEKKEPIQNYAKIAANGHVSVVIEEQKQQPPPKKTNLMTTTISSVLVTNEYQQNGFNYSKYIARLIGSTKNADDHFEIKVSKDIPQLANIADEDLQTINCMVKTYNPDTGSLLGRFKLDNNNRVVSHEWVAFIPDYFNNDQELFDKTFQKLQVLSKAIFKFELTKVDNPHESCPVSYFLYGAIIGSIKSPVTIRSR